MLLLKPCFTSQHFFDPIDDFFDRAFYDFVSANEINSSQRQDTNKLVVRTIGVNIVEFDSIIFQYQNQGRASDIALKQRKFLELISKNPTLESLANEMFQLRSCGWLPTSFTFYTRVQLSSTEQELFWGPRRKETLYEAIGDKHRFENLWSVSDKSRTALRWIKQELKSGPPQTHPNPSQVSAEHNLADLNPKRRRRISDSDADNQTITPLSDSEANEIWSFLSDDDLLLDDTSI
jgi:hypothetical protein